MQALWGSAWVSWPFPSSLSLHRAAARARHLRRRRARRGRHDPRPRGDRLLRRAVGDRRPHLRQHRRRRARRVVADVVAECLLRRCCSQSASACRMAGAPVDVLLRGRQDGIGGDGHDDRDRGPASRSSTRARRARRCAAASRPSSSSGASSRSSRSPPSASSTERSLGGLALLPPAVLGFLLSVGHQVHRQGPRARAVWITSATSSLAVLIRSCGREGGLALSTNAVGWLANHRRSHLGAAADIPRPAPSLEGVWSRCLRCCA